MRILFITLAITFISILTWFLPPPSHACPCSEIKPIAQDTNPNRQAGIAYTYSKEYAKEFNKAITDAYKACKQHIGEENIAIVSDIDETLLDNREGLAKLSEFDYSQFIDWINKANAPTLKPTAQFLKWARKNNFAIFLITGRKENERLPTIVNLLRRDIAYDGLYMRPNDNHDSADVFKSQIRQKIEKTGFKIIVNIGDQISDLLGGSALDCEKLPNKIYYVP
jgi:predicted secreted acid phosphatase